MERRVMIVDDEPDIRLTVQSILQEKGFNVFPAKDGQTCIDELEKGFKGVILMDVMMPKLDGWATIKEIHNRGLEEGNLISMLTAKQEPDEDMEALAESVFYYMRKPFESDELVAIVNDYCSLLEDIDDTLSDD